MPSEFCYVGLDDIARTSVVSLFITPSQIDVTGMTIDVALTSGETVDFYLEVGIAHAERPSADRFLAVMAGAQVQVTGLRKTAPTTLRVFRRSRRAARSCLFARKVCYRT